MKCGSHQSFKLDLSEDGVALNDFQTNSFKPCWKSSQTACYLLPLLLQPRPNMPQTPEHTHSLLMFYFGVSVKQMLWEAIVQRQVNAKIWWMCHTDAKILWMVSQSILGGGDGKNFYLIHLFVLLKFYIRPCAQKVHASCTVHIYIYIYLSIYRDI